MAAVFLALFLLTFLFDTRIGFLFLAAAIVTLYKGAPAKRLKAAGEPVTRQSHWKDPWGTGETGSGDPQ